MDSKLKFYSEKLGQSDRAKHGLYKPKAKHLTEWY